MHSGRTVVYSSLRGVKVVTSQVGSKRERRPCIGLLIPAYCRGHPALFQVLKAVTELAHRAQGHSTIKATPHARVGTVLLVARLCGEKFAGTPYENLFMTSES
jgi:hypothetical protein